MKNIFKLVLMLFASTGLAQNSEFGVTSNSFEDEMMPISTHLDTENSTSFEKAAEIYAIKQKTVKNFQGTTTGYYVIYDVFAKTRNLKSKVRRLNRRGFDAGYFLNPETKLKYLYLRRYNTWQKAFDDYNTNFDNRYKKDIWVLHIKNTGATEEFNSLIQTVNTDSTNSINTTTDTLLEITNKLSHKEDAFVDNTEPTEATKFNERVDADFALSKLNEMIKVENGIQKFKTEMIHFDFDTSFIKDDAAAELDKLVVAMKETPSMIIKIESHTDSRGSAVYNRYLSDKRAKSTRNYIIAMGVNPEQIESAIGYGEDKLLNDCDGTVACTEQQHDLNRRSVFIIVKM